MSNFNTKKIDSLYYTFAKCYALTSINIDNFNTELVTNMDCLFYGDTNLTEINLRSFNTENVKSFSTTFGQCTKDLKVYIKTEHNSNFIEKFQDVITIINETSI